MEDAGLGFPPNEPKQSNMQSPSIQPSDAIKTPSKTVGIVRPVSWMDAASRAECHKKNSKGHNGERQS